MIQDFARLTRRVSVVAFDAHHHMLISLRFDFSVETVEVV